MSTPNAPRTSWFALPDRLAVKSTPALIGVDDRALSVLTAALADLVADLEERLCEARRDDARTGRAALDRDQEVHRLSSRLRALRRHGADLCLGRMLPADGDPERATYVGRLGLTDRAGRRLLVDWRSPAAEPFFGATHADPMGIAGRRRYRWDAERIVDYWDEAFTDAGRAAGAAALDDQSAFIASLGAARTSRMRDVLATISREQDTIIRAGSRGTLVVDGGPGTGKTVVALHRTAYLSYADPRLREGAERRSGGVLFIGPSRAFLDYVADVLPGLGEEGVATATLRDLVPEGATALPEQGAAVAALKAQARMVAVIEPAVALYEEAPTATVEVETPWGSVQAGRREWAEAFAAPDPGQPHNEARDVVLEALVEILADSLEDPDGEHRPAPAAVLAAIRRSPALLDALGGAWPILEPTDVVGDLWTVPAYLRHCAPWLSADEVRALQRPSPQAWTTADLPLLDAARRRLGDPGSSRRARLRREAEEAAAAEMAEVVDHLIATDDSELQVMSMLRGDDLRGALRDGRDVPDAERDRLAGPFAHVVVDEAQELTDAEWQMLLARSPARSLTVVGDRAQARHGFAESWQERLGRVGLDRIERAGLGINYRTPAEVMDAAEPVIRAVLPDANVPTSVRSSGVPIAYVAPSEVRPILTDWLVASPTGIAAVIGPASARPPDLPSSDRIRTLTPELAKGLEFDLVVVTGRPAAGIEGGVDRYVAMTRATQRLVIVGAG